MATVKSLFTHGEGRYTTSDARTHWTSRTPRIVGVPLVSSRSGNVGSPALRVHARCQRASPTRHGPQSEEGDADAGGDVAGAYTPLWPAHPPHMAGSLVALNGAVCFFCGSATATLRRSSGHSPPPPAHAISCRPRRSTPLPPARPPPPPPPLPHPPSAVGTSPPSSACPHPPPSSRAPAAAPPPPPVRQWHDTQWRR